MAARDLGQARVARELRLSGTFAEAKCSWIE